MIDFPLLSLLLMFAFALMVLVFRLFKWGHDKEQRGERTDFMGRPNNHTGSREEMD